MPAGAPPITQRRNDLDALRSFAMVLGLVVHASLAFFPIPWIVHDTRPSGVLPIVFVVIHGFRMPLFFLLSGYFTMLVYRRRGLGSLLHQRVLRIAIPLLLALVTIVPLDRAIERHAFRTVRPEPWVADILAGDADAVRARLATGVDPDDRDRIYRRTLLSWADCSNHAAVVAAILDAGADPNARGMFGDSPLHEVVALGRDEATAVLLARGADPGIVNRSGRAPRAMMIPSPDMIAYLAPMIGLPVMDGDEIARGRERIRELLGDEPTTVAGRFDEAVLAYWRFLGSDRFRLRVAGTAFHLVDTNVFDHLWFLWFLCWLVAVFALFAVAGLTPTGRWRWWLVPLSCVPQAFMGQFMSGASGPDTSFGVLPQPHLLLYYGCFFFFGAATYAAEGLDTPLGRRWPILLPLAAVLGVASLVTIGLRPAATVIQPAFAWTMSLALIGLFRWLVPRPNATAAWLADAAYWMYLVHVPLVLLAQLAVREWPLAGEVKFVLILAAVTAALLASYRWCVRHTFVGTLLNGPRPC